MPFKTLQYNGRSYILAMVSASLGSEASDGALYNMRAFSNQTNHSLSSFFGQVGGPLSENSPGSEWYGAVLVPSAELIYLTAALIQHSTLSFSRNMRPSSFPEMSMHFSVREHEPHCAHITKAWLRSWPFPQQKISGEFKTKKKKTSTATMFTKKSFTAWNLLRL